MAYNTKSLLKDANGDFIPQYYDGISDTFKAMTNEMQLLVNGTKIDTNNRLPVDIAGATITATIGDQQSKTADVTLQNASTVVGIGTSFDVLSYKTLTLEITGTSSSRTIIFEGSSVSGAYYPIQGVKLQDLSFDTQTTGTGEVWQFDVTGLITFRARVSNLVGIFEVANLAISSAPTVAGNVTVTLNGVGTNVAVVTGTAEVSSLAVTAAPTVSGNATVTLNGVAANVAVTAGTAEVDTLTVTGAATATGNITVTLNGVGTTVAVAASDTVGAIGDKIRATAFTGWTVGGTAGTATVTFTKTTVGTNTAPSFTDTGTTGTTATITATTAGVAADTSTTVATKIRGASYSGWTTGGTGTTVTFTANAVGVKTDPTYSAGTTGATGTMTMTTQGVDADTTTTVATKIRGTAFTGWTTGGTGTTVTFTATTEGAKTDGTYSAGTTNASGTMTTTTQWTSPSLTVKGKAVA